MNARHEKYKLLERIGELIEGTLLPEAITDLQETLRTDASARRLYLQATMLETDLEWTKRERSYPWDVTPPPAVSTSSVSLASTPRAPGLHIRLGHWLTPQLVGWTASIVLVGYFVAVIGLLAWDRIRRADDHEQRAGVARSDAFARLTRADDASWNRLPSALAEDESKQQTLQVRSGLAELKFADGASVIVQGPAEFEVCSPSRGFLRRGKLVARVPSRAIGFTVATPAAEVVDLGTEFGVEVDEQKRTDVHVIRGKVQLLPAGATPSTQRAETLHAGQARRVINKSAGGASTISVEPLKFDATQFGQVDKKRELRVPMSSVSLVGYWRFDSIASGSTPDAARADGADDGAVTTVDNGLNGDSAVIVTDDTRGSVLALNNGFGATAGNGFVSIADIGNGYNATGATWSVWVKLGHAGSAANFPMFMTSGATEFRFFEGTRRLEIIGNNGVGFLPTVDVADAVALDTWHMVTFTSTAGATPTSDATHHLYLDGVLKKTSTTNFPTALWPGGAIRFGGRTGTTHTFTGYLDEAQIWNRALSPEKIKALYSSFVIPSFDALNLEVLFNVFDTTVSSTTGGLSWKYTTGLIGHAPGESWQVGNSYFLQLDGSGNGVTAHNSRASNADHRNLRPLGRRPAVGAKTTAAFSASRIAFGLNEASQTSARVSVDARRLQNTVSLSERAHSPATTGDGQAPRPEPQ